MIEAPRAEHDSVCVVIDDDPSVCDSLGILLETHGFPVRLYASGAEFLAASPRPIRCLIVDQHMPGMDGLEVVAALHRNRIFAPTVLITGRLDLATRQRAEQLGVLAILEKPFPTAQLLDLVPVDVSRDD